MTDPLPLRSPRTLEDPDLVADLQRDLGTDTLFIICAIEAALGVQIDHLEFDDAPADPEVENEQLEVELLEEAA